MKARNDKQKERIVSFLIIVCSLIIMLFWIGDIHNIFLVDDNYTQWISVVEENYDCFITSGRLPIFDFYQMKGMETSDCGYYGQHNALLFVSYIMGRKVLGTVNTFTIYIIFAFVLGNYGMYKVLRLLGNTRGNALVCTLTYACCGAFISYSYWYYVWMCYYIIPILLYSIVYSSRKDNWKAYVFPGLVLSYSLTLGNVQYTFYSYMVYGIIVFILLISQRSKVFLKKIITNISFSVLLSFPLLLNMLSAASRRSNIVVAEDGLLQSPIPINKFFIFSITPVNIWTSIFENSVVQREFAFEGAFCHVPFSSCYMGLSIVAYIILPIYGVVKLIKNNNDGKSVVCKENAFYIGTYLAATFFILMSFGRSGIIGIILSKIPVVSSFQFAFKAIFIIDPLIIIILSKIFSIFREYKKKIYKLVICLSLCFAIFGVVQNRWIVNSGIHTFFHPDDVVDQSEVGGDIRNRLDAIGIDIDNYRISSVLCVDTDNDWGQDYTVNRWINHYITGNMATRVKAFTLGAYEPAVQMDSFIQCNRLLRSLDYDFYRANAISGYAVIPLLESDEAYYNEFIEQMKTNSVKYLIFEKDSDFLNRFIAAINSRGGLEILSCKDFYSDRTIVELGGIPRLVWSADEDINLKASIDTLEFDVISMADVKVGFTYNKHFKANALFDSGEKRNLTIKPDNNGDMIITGLANGRKQHILISYVNPLSEFSVIIAWITTLAFVCVAYITQEK